jgi:hypothetical protein
MGNALENAEATREAELRLAEHQAALLAASEKRRIRKAKEAEKKLAEYRRDERWCDAILYGSPCS